MQNKSKLKQPKEKYANNDLTKAFIKMQQEIREMAKVGNEKGQTTSVCYQKIRTEGIVWKWNNTGGRTSKKIMNQKDLGIHRRRKKQLKQMGIEPLFLEFKETFDSIRRPI